MVLYGYVSLLVILNGTCAVTRNHCEVFMRWDLTGLKLLFLKENLASFSLLKYVRTSLNPGMNW